MKTHLAVLMTATAFAAVGSDMVAGEAYVKQPQPAIRVETYNIRYSDGDRWTLNSWWCRKGDLRTEL